jgi:hypothetical protein
VQFPFYQQRSTVTSSSDNLPGELIIIRCQIFITIYHSIFYCIFFYSDCVIKLFFFGFIFYQFEFLFLNGGLGVKKCEVNLPLFSLIPCTFMRVWTYSRGRHSFLSPPVMPADARSPFSPFCKSSVHLFFLLSDVDISRKILNNCICSFLN